MVYRVFVEKRPELANEAKALRAELVNLLGIKGLKSVRVFNRYDVENIAGGLFAEAVRTVFSEPQLDVVSDELPVSDGIVFAVEFLPGQFDQRADSAAQCIQILSQGERPLIRTWTAAHQAPQSLGFSRQEHWSGLPCPPPMHESEM